MTEDGIPILIDARPIYPITSNIDNQKDTASFQKIESSRLYDNQPTLPFNYQLFEKDKTFKKLQSLLDSNDKIVVHSLKFFDRLRLDNSSKD